MNVLKNGEIVLYGAVGMDWWDCFTALDVMSALYSLDPAAPVTVRINSGGGDVAEGIAIANMLAAHPGTVTCVVDAVAASAASIIALGGDETIMRPGTLLMIHDPSTIAMGDAADLTAAADMLETFAQAMASIYAQKTGRTVAQCRADMKTETWYTAEDAVAAKFADSVGQPQTGGGGTAADPDPEVDDDDDGDPAVIITIETPEAAAFDYRVYASAPKLLTDLAIAKNWTAKPQPRAKKAARKPQQETMPMTTAPNPAAPIPPAAPTSNNVAAEIAALCAKEGVAMMASALIREGLTLEAATARIAGAKDVRAAVDLARKSCPAIEASLADTFIAAGTSIEGVRAQLFEKMAGVQANISNAHQPGPMGNTNGTAPAALDVTAIYANYNGPRAAA